MILDLRECDEFPARKLIEGNPEKFSLDYDGVLGVKEVTIDLAIQKAGEEFFCQGEVKAIVSLECARCLAQFDAPITGRTDFIVCSEGLHDAERDGIVDDEDYVYFHGSEMSADISEMVRQAVVLAISMKPVCSEECRGLCSGCGKNLNEGDCSCRNDKIDERWEALKRLTDDK